MFSSRRDVALFTAGQTALSIALRRIGSTMVCPLLSTTMQVSQFAHVIALRLKS